MSHKVEVEVDLSLASYHASTLKEFAHNEKAEYKRRALYDAANFLEQMCNSLDDENCSGCTDD